MSILSSLLKLAAPIAWASLERELYEDILAELPQGTPNVVDTADRCAKAAIRRFRRKTRL